MKQKILLIHPQLGYMDQQRDKPGLPLNILSAASFLTNNYNLELIDQRLIKKDFFNVLEKKLKEDLLFVAITCYSGPMIKHALAISEFIQNNSSTLVVWGGVHPSLLPEQTIKNKYIDIVVIGEGEETLKELTQAISQKKDLKGIPGIFFKKDNQIIKNQPRQFSDLNTLPIPAYKIIDLKNYIQNYGGKKYIYYQISRGCPKKCAYCYNIPFNKGKFRYKKIENVFSEIKELKKQANFDGIYFVDDNLFCLPKEYLQQLAIEMKKNNLLWLIQGGDIVSLDKFATSDFEFFSKHGLRRITIGIETGSPRMRNVINKEGSLETIKSVMKKLNKLPIYIYCSYIINLPTETIEDIKMSIKLIMEIKKINKKVHNSPFLKYTPFYGTPLVENHKNLLKTPNTLEEWGEMSWEQLQSPVFVEHLEDNHFFKFLVLTSLLSDTKVSEYSNNILIKTIGMLYRPIANFRLKNLWFKLGIDLFVFEKLFKIF